METAYFEEKQDTRTPVRKLAKHLMMIMTMEMIVATLKDNTPAESQACAQECLGKFEAEINEFLTQRDKRA